MVENSVGLAPTIMLSVPAAAASRVRATGASENSIPAAASRTPTARASATLVVLRSTTISPRLPLAAMPALPKQTSLTCCPLGRERKTMSDAAATSAMEPAARAPEAATSRSAAGLRSKAWTGAGCFLTRLQHIGAPMTPRPMKPIVGAELCIGRSVHRYAALDVAPRAGGGERGSLEPDLRIARNYLQALMSHATCGSGIFRGHLHNRREQVGPCQPMAPRP